MQKKRRAYNIYRRSDGRFEGRIKLKQLEARRHSQRPSYYYIYAKSEIECALKIEQLLSGDAELIAEDKTQSRVRYEKLCMRWLNYIRVKVKESTAANYMYIQERYLLPYFARCTVKDIDEHLVNHFVSGLTDRGYAASTVNNIIIIFKMALFYGEFTMHLPNPLRYFRITKPTDKKEKRRISDDDWRRLKQLIKNEKTPTAAAIYLAVCTGMRIGEICALRRCDIDLNRAVLFVRSTVQRVRISEGEKRKTKLLLSRPKSHCSHRVIPLPEALIDVMHDLCSQLESEDFLFGVNRQMPLEPRTMQYRFKRYLKFHNMPYVNFHQLRHKFAGSCVEQNFDLKSLSEILGHSNVNITLNYYVHPTLDFKRRQLNMMLREESIEESIDDKISNKK